MCFLGVQMCTGLDFTPWTQTSMSSNVSFRWKNLGLTSTALKNTALDKSFAQDIFHPILKQISCCFWERFYGHHQPFVCLRGQKHFCCSDAVKFPGLVCTDVFHCSRYLKNSPRKLNLMSGLKPLSSWLIFWSSCFLHFSLALPFFQQIVECQAFVLLDTTEQCVVSPILKFKRFHPNLSKHALAAGSGSDHVHE